MTKRRIIVFITFSLISLLISCSGGNNETAIDDKVSDETSEEKLIEDAIYTYQFINDDCLLLFVTNPNSFSVNVNLKINFYDDNKNLIIESFKSINVMDNLGEAIVSVEDVPINSTSFDVDVETNVVDDVTSIAKVMDILTNDMGTSIDVVINNYTDNDLDLVRVGLVFYSSDNIVAYRSYEEVNVTKQTKVTTNVKYPLDSDGNLILFEKVETVVNEAYDKLEE